MRVSAITVHDTGRAMSDSEIGNIEYVLDLTAARRACSHEPW
jgi:hypothetical protein